MFKTIIPALCLLSGASAQIRGLSGLTDPKSVEIKECVAKPGVEFNSQYREDEAVIEHFFKNKCGGTVVEMGGYDGKTFSNSWYFQVCVQSFEMRPLTVLVVPGSSKHFSNSTFHFRTVCPWVAHSFG